MSDPTKRHPELEAAIEKDPDHIDAYRVYADWLQEQGDPRGELIALQCEAHGLPDELARDFLDPADTLLNQHGDSWLGGLAGLEHQVKWRFGFIESLRLPGMRSTRTDLDRIQGDFLRRFMALPVARFLKRLELVPVVMVAENILSWPVFESLNRAAYPTLETLVLDKLEIEPEYHGFLLLLDPVRLSREAFPRLRSLTIHGSMDRLADFDLDLPELRELKLSSNVHLLYQEDCLMRMDLPGLERVMLQGHAGRLSRLDESDKWLQGLLQSERMPHLKHLGVNWGQAGMESEASAPLCGALARSRLLRQLESLDLSGNQLDDGCAEVLLDHAAAFKNLRHLDLRDNHLSSRVAARVAAMGETVVEVSGQRRPRSTGRKQRA